MEVSAAKFRIKDITYIAVFTALLAVCSWIAIPTPTRIDFTLQTMGIFLAVGILGGQRGTLAILAYILLGLVGAPVFSGFSGGPGALLTPSGGYLIGFLFTGLAMWAMEKILGEKPWVLAVSMLLGMIVYDAFGTAWFMTVYPMNGESVGLWTALGWCVLPYIGFDLIKLVLAFFLSIRLRSHAK
ncbi:MAG: biotin transporter BioY [Oscillospiraceae bacterium]|nr:biotin transporter BioY [Oscillospiraceae bacterium]